MTSTGVKVSAALILGAFSTGAVAGMGEVNLPGLVLNGRACERMDEVERTSLDRCLAIARAAVHVLSYGGGFATVKLNGQTRHTLTDKVLVRSGEREIALTAWIEERAHPPGSPGDVVRRLLKAAESADFEGQVFARSETPLMRQFLSRGLASDWLASGKLDWPTWNGNVFAASQENSFGKLLGLRVISYTGQVAVIGTKVEIREEGSKVHNEDHQYVLVKEGGQWKVDDIAHDASSAEGGSLHSALIKALAESRNGRR